ncbi:hypothetical protein KFE25_001140 [Diacronema lutheri]|uniref:Uncharacterized protein n=2 Tax=Diacronema lutheri TaxID=2081491 RepID=A0A8J5X9U5_DIALT|nr:hypothetical protein KFE25_001140 [Diacronema lutheri]
MGSLSVAEDADALLHAALVGDDALEYANLVGRLASPRLSAAEARQLLAACARHASAVSDERHGELLAAALRARWAEEAGVAEAYASLAQELIARSTAFVEPFLASVVDAFASAAAPLAHDVADIAHAMLRSVLFTCPLAARTLCDLIHARFPHRRLATPVHTHYLRHVLRVMSYEPYVQPVLVPYIVQQLLAIDAEARMPVPLPPIPPLASHHASVLDDDLDADDEPVFPMDDMLDETHAGAAAAGGGIVNGGGGRGRGEGEGAGVGGWGGSGGGGRRIGDSCVAGGACAAAGGSGVGGPAPVDPDAEKLDALLSLLFEFWHRLVGPPSAPAAHGADRASAGARPPLQPMTVHAAAREVASGASGAAGGGGKGGKGEMLVFGLLSAFDAFIVRSHSVQCVHFALLVGTSCHREHAGALLGYFARKLGADSDETFAVRQACIGYAASYAASASFLDAHAVHAALEILLAHAHTLAAALLGGVAGGAAGGAAGDTCVDAGPLSPGAGSAQTARVAMQRSLTACVVGSVLILERRWALWSGVFLAADGAAGGAGGGGGGGACEQGEGALGRLRALLELDPAVLLGAMHPASASFALRHLSAPRAPHASPHNGGVGTAGAARTHRADTPGAERAERGAATPSRVRPGAHGATPTTHHAVAEGRASYATAVGFALPFEVYPPLPESAAFVAPLLLPPHPPPAQQGARAARPSGGACGGGCGARRGVHGAGAGAGGAVGERCGESGSPSSPSRSPTVDSCSCSLHSGGVHPGSAHDGGSLRLPVSLGHSAPQPHNLSPLRLGASPTAAHRPQRAHGRTLGAEGGSEGSSAIPLVVQAGFAQWPRVPGARQSGGHSLPEHGSLNESLTNCSMSFSPDDLESHIRQRFEECTRAAVTEGGNLRSPGSSPPPCTFYGGFDALGRHISLGVP